MRATFGGAEAKSGGALFEPLIRLLINDLRDGADRVAASSRAVAPLFSLVYKSLCVHLGLRGRLQAETARAERVSDAWKHLLDDLFKAVCKAVAARARTTVTIAKRLVSLLLFVLILFDTFFRRTECCIWSFRVSAYRRLRTRCGVSVA